MSKQNAKLVIKDLTKSFKHKLLFDNLNITILPGEWIGIVGKNGSGKSTLAKIISGLEKPNQGTIFFEGKSKQNFSKKEWFKKVQLITQYSRNALDPSKKVKNILLEPVKRFDLDLTVDKQVILRQILFDCHLPEKILNNYPAQLSGGQYQRVCVALALLVKPEILICDEATASLDRITELRILKLLKQKDLSVIFISHDSILFKDYCDRCIYLS